MRRRASSLEVAGRFVVQHHEAGHQRAELVPGHHVVAEALASAKRALSAQELYERIQRTHPTLGRATVYRALEAQVQDGMASRFERDGHVSAYIACDAEHHHHLVCTNCQRVEDLNETEVAPLLASVGRRHEFQVDHAALDFYGLCRSCRRKRS